MFNYIRSELYRISHKKSFYLFYGILTLGFLGVMAISQITDFRGESLVQFAYLLISMSIVIVGTQVFITVYNDEISAHTLASIIGQGISRTVIILSKIIVMFITTLVAYIWLGLVFFAMYLVINKGFPATDFSYLSKILVLGMIAVLVVVGFASITSIVTYGFQKTSISVTFMVLVMTNFFDSMLSLLSSIGVIHDLFGDLSRFTFMTAQANLTNGILVNTINTGAVLQMAAWFIGSIIVAVLVFRKKELEF